MKYLLIICVLSISACCATKYDVDSAPPGINLLFDYTSKGFAKNDTSFTFEFHKQDGTFTTDVIDLRRNLGGDSARAYYLYYYNLKKLVIKSNKSTYNDSLLNIGFSSEKKQLGNKRCGNTYEKYSNVHATYQGTEFNSGSSTEIDVVIKP
ncbi:MAG: hypothetical protein V4613_02595 [Bacteroidota bacterium]